MDRGETIRTIRAALRRRSGRAWSVTAGRGTTWGWITITAPPARLDRCGGMSDIDRAELSRLLGQPVHHQGAVVEDSSADYREFTARAAGTWQQEPA